MLMQQKNKLCHTCVMSSSCRKRELPVFLTIGRANFKDRRRDRKPISNDKMSQAHQQSKLRQTSRTHV